MNESINDDLDAFAEKHNVKITKTRGGKDQLHFFIKANGVDVNVKNDAGLGHRQHIKIYLLSLPDIFSFRALRAVYFLLDGGCTKEEFMSEASALADDLLKLKGATK